MASRRMGSMMRARSKAAKKANAPRTRRKVKRKTKRKAKRKTGIPTSMVNARVRGMTVPVAKVEKELKGLQTLVRRYK